MLRYIHTLKYYVAKKQINTNNNRDIFKVTWSSFLGYAIVWKKLSANVYI